MKHFRILIIAILAASGATALHAQKINTWKGGFPGQETNWHCPRNWSLGVVPDWACQVVIPQQTSDRKNYPVLSTRNEEIYSLTIQPGARLEVAASGELTVSSLDSEYALSTASHSGLVVYGKFITPDASKPSIAQH